MKRCAVLASVISLSVVLCLSNAFSWDTEYRKGFTVSSSVELSDLVVVGEVVKTRFVYRENIVGNFTTDVTVEVSQVIKGTPNAGKDRVEFMIEGGVHGEEEVIVSGEPKFEVGETLLLFLFKGTGDDYKHHPHDRYQVLRGFYGKRLVKDSKVGVMYLIDDEDDDTLIMIGMPLDLAVQLAKAAVKDQKATALLEEGVRIELQRQMRANKNLRDNLGLSQSFTDRLKRDAKQIIEKESEPKNKE